MRTKDGATLEEVREALKDGRGAWLTDGEGHVRALSIAYNGYLVSGSELGLHIGAEDTFQIELPEEEHLRFPSDLSIRCDHNSLKKAYEDFLDKPEDDTILDVPIPPLAIGEDVVAEGLRKAAERLKGMSDKEVDQALAEANPDTPGDGWAEWPIVPLSKHKSNIVFQPRGVTWVEWQWCVAQRDRFGGFVFVMDPTPRDLPWRVVKGKPTEYAVAVRMKREDEMRWKCDCGNNNHVGQDVCSYCGNPEPNDRLMAENAALKEEVERLGKQIENFCQSLEQYDCDCCPWMGCPDREG